MKRLFGILGVIAALVGCEPAPSAPSGSYNWPSPPGSRLLLAETAQRVRHFALSSGGRQIAFVEDGAYPAPLMVASIDGKARQIGTLARDVERLQWAPDGESVLYVDREEVRVPGTEMEGAKVLAYLLVQQPVIGGASRVLLRSPSNFTFDVPPQGEFVTYTTLDPAGASALKRLHLGTLQEETLVESLPGGLYQMSPDGTAVAYWDQGDVPGLRVVTVANREVRTVASSHPMQFMWMRHGHSLLLANLNAPGGRVEMKEVDLKGESLGQWSFDIGEATFQLGKGSESLSPDGKRLWAFGSGDRNLILSLETGQVSILPSFGYIFGWINERTVIARYKGGLYAVPVDPAP